MLLSPLLSPLLSSIFSFPLPPLSNPPSPLPPVLVPAPGEPLLWISWGPPAGGGGGGPVDCPLPPTSATPPPSARASPCCRSSGLEGAQPYVPPGSVSVCKGWGWAGPGLGPGRLDSLSPGEALTFPCSQDRQIPSPTRGLPCTLRPPNLHSPWPFLTPLGTQITLTPPLQDPGVLRG